MSRTAGRGDLAWTGRKHVAPTRGPVGAQSVVFGDVSAGTELRVQWGRGLGPDEAGLVASSSVRGILLPTASPCKGGPRGVGGARGWQLPCPLEKIAPWGNRRGWPGPSGSEAFRGTVSALGPKKSRIRMRSGEVPGAEPPAEAQRSDCFWEEAGQKEDRRWPGEDLEKEQKPASVHRLRTA